MRFLSAVVILNSCACFSQLAEMPYHPLQTAAWELEESQIRDARIRSMTMRTNDYSGTTVASSKLYFEYNSEGKITMEAYYYRDSILYNCVQYAYNNKGQKLYWRSFGLDTSISQTYVYHYDAYGNFVPAGYVSICDKKNRPVKFYQESDPKRYFQLLYDKDGRVHTLSYGYGDAYADVDSFVYDKQSNISEIYSIKYSYFHLYPNGKDSLITSREVTSIILRKFDAWNNLISSEKVGAPDAFYRAEYIGKNLKVKSYLGENVKEFTTDDYGNLLTVKEFRDTFLLRETYYSYEYWP